ncbi:MAG: hypothetical protein AAB558_02975 [Patescibacteria group bacterium]
MQDKRSKLNWRHRLKQFFLAWVMVVVFALPIAGVLVTRPQPALAQGAPTIDIANLTQNLGKFIKDVVLEGLKQGAALAFKNALKVFVSQIAYDTAVWIGSGDENQKPLLYTKDVGAYLTDVGDAAAGEFLNTLFSENGYFEYDLCQPTDIDAQLFLNLAIGIAIPQSNFDTLGIQLPEADMPVVECTFTDITENFQESSLDADFATNVALIFIPTNNDFGVYSTAVGAGYEVTADQGEEAVIDRLKGDFMAVDGKVSDYVATPGSVVEHQYFLSLDASSYPQTTYTGQLLADTIDIFTSTLISKLLERLKNGLIADFTTPNITDSLSGSSSTSGGVSAAEEKYLTFKEIPLTRGGDIDILSDLANCPDQGRDVTNCVIDEGFRSAIEQGKTVQQALDEGLIDGGRPFGFGEGGLPIESPEEGIQYRSTIILKHYRIVPVGWQIAAEYLRDFGGGTSITLQDLVDAYDQCDSTDYSPYCKLVDPDWVLTSPAGICNLQGYGQNVLSSRFEDDDGLDSTPERPNLLRAQTCVDDQSCLKTDSDGNCIAYGYCTEEKRIYRFQGDECPEQNSSCQTYSDSNGDETSYLRNTLNFNNCNANSVGCQWYCTEYNEINLDWQCSQNGYTYETCSTTSSAYDSASGTCACTADDASACDMQEGAFKCSTDLGTACTLGEVADSAVVGQDSAINFNNQVATCADGDVGCTTYTETTTGANLIFNSSFEYFNAYSDVPEDVVRGEDELTDTTFDTFGFYAADSSDPGTACVADSGTDECIGWEKTGRVFATSDDVFDGFVAAELEGVATLTYELETGYTLANRTFDLSFMSQNTGTTGCLGEVTLNGELLENLDYTGGSSSNLAYEGDQTWTTNVFEAYTYPSTTSDTTTELSLHITVPSSCADPIKFDSFDLTETDDSSDYTAYGTTELISMNGDALECAVEDVGCEEYTPVGGTSTDAIPGQITNPLSEACAGADGFADSSCSQCNGTTSDDEFVGCDFYQEQPLTNAAPVPSLAGFTTLPTGDEREGIVQRTGFYCNNSGYEGVSCYDDTDCGSSGECIDSVSIIPSTADICSAQYVGCEEYTNLDVVSEGGEGLEYYSYIKQCVKDTPEQRDNDEISTFVTFEGSDVSGYSLRSFDLKKSNVDDGPCTNLDLYGSTAESSEADCIDDTTAADADGDGIIDGSGQKTCSASSLGTVDADCTEFIDPDTGTSYYRLKSYTITASDDCHPLRNELDGRIYYSVPSESTECPVSQNLCREYKGSAGGDVFQAINEDFEDAVWDSVGTGTVEQSSESTAAGGHSMHLSSGTATYDLFTVGDEGTTSSLDEGKTYVVELWAKEADGGSGLSVYFDSATSTSADASVYFVENSVNSVSGETVTITEGDWNKYTFGPVIMPRAGEADDQFVIYWDDSTDLYIDNVVLEESDAQYLIKNTADTCAGYEGCEDYTDRAGDTHYIKSFSRLCEEQYVGCEAIIDTQNSDSPFTQEFNTENDFTSSTGPNDDVTVAADQVVAWVNDEDNYCTASAAGCTEFGQPEVDETSGYADSFTAVTYLNDPDSYSSILCETDALACDEYTSSNDELVYFKDPGDRTCEYRQETDGSDFAWFITGTDTECPLFDETDSPSQPMGAICDGGDRDGLFCVSDEDCPDDDTTDTDEPHCRSDLSTDADGNTYPDTGWTGTCSAAYSGCTEYQDTATDNLIPNGGFEEDVYDYDENSGETDESVESSDGVPDYFENFLFGCDKFAQSTSEAHTGTDSLEIAQDGLSISGDGIGCSVVPEERIDIDASKTYTLSANVMVPHAFSGTVNASLVSLGLYYYDADGSFLFYDYDGDGTKGDADDYVEFNVAAAAETISSDENGVWMRYSGQVGNRLEMAWPSVNNQWGADVASVRPFVYAYTPSGEALYVDNFSLTENSAYFYVNESVDGAPESDQNTCNGEVDIGGGCVAFRDVTNKDLTYLSAVEAETEVNSEFSVSSCIIGATESDDENCRFNADTADGNAVLQVRPDRECETWLSCLTASITTDSEGNEEITCLEIGGCDELSDSGLCSNSLGHTDADDLGSSDDLTLRSRAGSTSRLDDLLNLSGYSTVGVEWGETDGACTSGACVDGPHEGDTCSTDDDCQDDMIIQGYYPYEDMVQEGEDGLSDGNDDLIEFGDFETVNCSATSPQYLSFDGGSTAVSVTTVFSSSIDKGQTCVVDDHCRNPNTEAKMTEIENADDQGTADVEYKISSSLFVDLNSSFNYADGWCENPDELGEGWELWDPTDTSTFISIVEYDPSVDFSNPTSADDQFFEDPQAGSITLDLDNVLYVQPSGAGQGVEYALDVDGIVNASQYAVSFNAAFGEATSGSEHLTVGLRYSDGSTETTDYFHICDSEWDCGNTVVEIDSTMTSYALTVTASDKQEDTTSITLFIQENGDSGFYLDDVSMLPVLEVNKSLDDVARECRAYPAESALLCHYEDNGAVYQGVEGYCVEHDGLFTNKCVTWWPVDVISGANDVRTKTAVGYTGRVPVYYCALAKGLEDLAVCDGGDRDGAICTGQTDAYCQGSSSSGECVSGVYYTDDYEGIYGLDHTNTTDLGTQGYQSVAREITFVMDGDKNSNSALLARISPPTAPEEIITLSDINEIRISMEGGDQEAGDSTEEWPLINDIFSLTDTYSDVTSQTYHVTVADDGSLTQPDGTDIVPEDMLYVIQNDSGADDGLYCRWVYNGIDENGTGELQWVFSSENDLTDQTNFLGGPTFCNQDLFDETNWEGSDIGQYLDYPDTPAEEFALYDEDAVGGNQILGRSYFGENNAIGFRWYFEEGILKNLAWVVWSDEDDDYVEAQIKISYSLNESCVLAVQTVSDDGDTRAWLDRLTADTTYTLPNSTYGYSDANSPYGAVHTDFSEYPDMWTGGTFNTSPFLSDDTAMLTVYRESESSGSASPLACVGKCSTNMCQGYNALHGGSYGGESQTCNEDEGGDGVVDYDCSAEGDGLCLGLDGHADNSAQGVVETYDPGNGYSQAVSDYNDQITAAFMTAREDLRLIFVELQGGNIWKKGENDDRLEVEDIGSYWSNGIGGDSMYDEMEECSGSRSNTDYCGIRPTINNIEVNSQTQEVFIEDGESIRLSFGTDADDNQVPLSQIRILWEGIDGHTFRQDWDDQAHTEDNWNAAPSDNHIYSRSYNCDESDTDHYEDLDDSDGDGYAGVCVYEIRLEIEDNWDFCSGLQDDDSLSEYRSTQDGYCDAYDEFNGFIVVSPD